MADTKTAKWRNRRPVRALRGSPIDWPGVRRVTVGMRQCPDFVIIGAQRSGTTSLRRWLNTHPQVQESRINEIHYFDNNFRRGQRWYRSNFPIHREGQLTGESTPYMLFHPLAPQRATDVLPSTTKFIVLLREPVERAISQYWLNRRRRHESESFARAIELEPERLAGQEEIVLSGVRSNAHQRFSYTARGHYAEQLERWFAQTGRDRILVLKSEDLFTADGVSSVLDWLGLAPLDKPFIKENKAPRREEADGTVVADLRQHFEPYNKALEDLMGRPFWSTAP